MKFEEAIVKLKEGKKIKRKEWEKEGIKYSLSLRKPATLSSRADILADDWVIEEEVDWCLSPHNQVIPQRVTEPYTKYGDEHWYNHFDILKLKEKILEDFEICDTTGECKDVINKRFRF